MAVDIINFGEENVNTSKLEKFHSIVNNHDSSHLVTIPPGPRLLYEVVATSPILVEDGAFGGASGEQDFLVEVLLEQGTLLTRTWIQIWPWH